MRNFLLLWSIVLGYVLGSQAVAGTDISGTVTFRRHLTASETDTFWTAVLRGEQGRFELQTPLAVGSPEQPMSAVIGGAALYSGDVIRAHGTLVRRDRETQFLGKLESVVVVERGRGEPVRPPAPFGWSCHSVTTQPINLHASLFLVANESYQLRVVAVQGEPAEPIFYPLLRLQNVRADADQDRLVYSGESGMAKAELTIREIAGEIHLPASLRLVRSQLPPADPLGPVSETAMVCTPTRNLDP